MSNSDKTEKYIPPSLRVFEQNLEKELVDFLIERKNLGSQEAVWVCMTIRPYVLEGLWAKVGAGFSGAYEFEYKKAIDDASRNLDSQTKKVLKNLRQLILDALSELEKKGLYDQLNEYCFKVWTRSKENSSEDFGQILENEFAELSSEMKNEVNREKNGLTQELVMSVFNESFKGRFNGMSDEQLVDTFNRELGNPEWVSSRELFQLALLQEFEDRKYDYSAIETEEGLSFKKKIRLVDNKILVARPSFLNIFR